MVMHRTYWPALDGLRAVAVLAVISYHAFPDISPNGYAGVDVFFVLSGFLITSLLLREHAANGTVDLRKFYLRRVLRLYPALLACVIMVATFSLIRGTFSGAWPGMLSALAYVSHVTIGLGIGSGLLSHTWTLSLEEHYYLFWPVALLGLLQRGMPRALAGAAIICVLLLVVPGVLPTGLGQMYWRALPMLVGSGAAFMYNFLENGRFGSMPLQTSLATLSLVCILVLPMPIPEVLMQGPLGLPTLLTTVLVLGITRCATSLASRVLSFRAARWIGRRAYGLYLYHFPILLLPLAPHILSSIGIELALGGDLMVGISLTFAVAACSFRWIEKPALALKDRVARAPG